MIFSDKRADLRRQFLEAWRKTEAGRPLMALEELIASVIREHPEYLALFEQGEAAIERDWTPEMGETNPFLHMSLHIAVREQLSIDRPAGIRQVFEVLVRMLGETHVAEHELLEALAETLWEAQRAGMPPDEQLYLARARQRTVP